MSDEKIRPVAGYEDLYTVSDTGIVRSLPRRGGNNRVYGGKELPGSPDSKGYLRVQLCRAGIPNKLVRVHVVTNLAYGSQQDNMFDMVRNTCKRGHVLSSNGKQRLCTVCKAENDRARYLENRYV